MENEKTPPFLKESVEDAVWLKNIPFRRSFWTRVRSQSYDERPPGGDNIYKNGEYSFMMEINIAVCVIVRKNWGLWFYTLVSIGKHGHLLPQYFLDHYNNSFFQKIVVLLALGLYFTIILCSWHSLTPPPPPNIYKKKLTYSLLLEDWSEYLWLIWLGASVEMPACSRKIRCTIATILLWACRSPLGWGGTCAGAYLMLRPLPLGHLPQRIPNLLRQTSCTDVAVCKFSVSFTSSIPLALKLDPQMVDGINKFVCARDRQPFFLSTGFK